MTWYIFQMLKPNLGMESSECLGHLDILLYINKYFAALSFHLQPRIFSHFLSQIELQ